MQNIKVETKGNVLTITVDLSKRLGPSKSGKTILVATTSGNGNVGVEGIKFGLNVFAPL